jgi:hypothetical protein
MRRFIGQQSGIVAGVVLIVVRIRPSESMRQTRSE